MESVTRNALDEVKRIVQHASLERTVLRAVGGAAIRVHAHGFAESPAVRRDIADLDMITYSKHERSAIKVLNECGYVQDRSQAYLRALIGRSILGNAENQIVVDLFYNKLHYNHIIDLRTRLEVDTVTIPLAELFLQKAQIIQINEKDAKDVILLLREHAIGRSDRETINIDRICDILSNDWGFYYTVTTNLEKIADYTTKLTALEESDRLDVLKKIEELRDQIESCPKSFGWKVRAKIGARKKWYDDVEELYAGH